jgi:hypothetical protein
MRMEPTALGLLGTAVTVLNENIAPRLPLDEQPALRDIEAALARAGNKLARELPANADDFEALEQARFLLRGVVLDRLPKECQYDARLIAKVVAIATSELTNGSAPERVEFERAAALMGEAPPAAVTARDVHRELALLYARLSQDIRAGRTDPSTARHAPTLAHLREMTLQAVRESNPAYLRKRSEAPAAVNDSA